MLTLATILVLALTRAEILERMKAPVITQCEGLVQVYASCPEDMRREYQMPVASFAAETVKALYRGLAIAPKRHSRAGIMVYIGDVRTNDTTVIARASTNDARVATRIYLKSPGFADLRRLRLEVIKAFCRCVAGEEVDDEAAVLRYRQSDPRFRIEDERRRLATWLAGTDAGSTREDDEANLARIRKVIEPGVATRDDVRLFASRLFLYPSEYDRPFCGRYGCLSFSDAARLAKADANIRLSAYRKSSMMIVYGGGRGERLAEASKAYFSFLLEVAKGELEEQKLKDILEDADTKLNLALEEAPR